jgi:Flp pilus assembly pilin Flp
VQPETVSWFCMVQRLRIREFLACSIGGFWRDEAGQDLIEYTLLLAFVALASAALFSNVGTSVSKVWSVSNTTLSTAVLKAAS